MAMRAWRRWRRMRPQACGLVPTRTRAGCLDPPASASPSGRWDSGALPVLSVWLRGPCWVERYPPRGAPRYEPGRMAAVILLTHRLLLSAGLTLASLRFERREVADPMIEAFSTYLVKYRF